MGRGRHGAWVGKRLGTLVAHGQRRPKRCSICAIHGGKDNVPLPHLSFPAGRYPRLGRAPGSSWITSSRSTTSTTMAVSFSTSQGRGRLHGPGAGRILPPDYWRWWLLSHAPETSDAEFTWEGFQQDVNKELADVLGNFVSRITKFCRSKFGEVVPEGGAIRTAGGGADRRPGGAVEGATRRIWTRSRSARQRPSCGRSGLAGNEVPAIGRALDGLQGRPPSGRRRSRAFALNLIPFYAGLSAPFFIPMPQRRWPRGDGRGATWPDSAEAALSALPGGHGPSRCPT